MGRKLSQVMWFECLKILTHINCAICMYRWEGWWKCLKMLWYFKIPKDCNTFIIFETLKQTVTQLSRWLKTCIGLSLIPPKLLCKRSCTLLLIVMKLPQLITTLSAMFTPMLLTA
jgi:hypothetical protein